MSVIKKIIANLDRMSPADREIGRFVADNPDKMLGLSTSALAEKTGRSQSSVVKFAQRLGFASYQDLKMAISATRAYDWRLPGGAIHGSIEKGDNFQTIFEKLIASKYLAMRETMGANGARDMGRAVEALNSSRRVYLAGVGASSLVASDFTFKLQKIGRVVFQSPDAHIQMANVAGMSDADVLVAVSYSGSSTETLRIAELAKSRGAPVIAITSMRDNLLARLADIQLHTVADEEQARSSSITARDAQLALTDMLFLAIVQGQDDAQNFILQSEASVSALKTKLPYGR